MIRIGKPYLAKIDSQTRVVSDLDVDGRKTQLWFETTEEWTPYLVFDRADAWVLALLHYAMQHRHDIVCDAPVTDRLLDGVVGQFLPAFFKANPEAYPTKVIAEPIPEIEHSASTAVGTGVSCGVDSLHVFAKHPEITHGCIWNGHGQTSGETYESRRQAWEDIQQQARGFTRYVGVKLVVGNTNFDRGCLADLKWDGGTTQGNLFCIYSLQKLWRTYYIASDCDINNFKFKISLHEDPAHYEFFFFPYVSLANIAVRMDGAECNRFEKMIDVVKYEPSKKFLNVCWGIQDGHRNCSCFCPKCMRTMLSLWLLDALDEYDALFDVDYFKSHFEQYLAEHYRGLLQHDFFQEEMRDLIAQRKIPLFVKMSAWRIVGMKAFRKLLRGGAQSYRFRPN